ncbi:MFS family permease [Rhodopseudomonas julia]|uniref:MFS family permease n=1 Tax=Rhodopseudomonas julia TaxID=200617 RepID=A0ABU0C4I5_9BRAD|nr:MFS family permease [Rhodopseudomonas julia]
MRSPLVTIYTAGLLDAAGIGLIFPILPSRLSEATHASSVAPHMGVMTALYAVLQFVFAPALGALSDREGRGRVLLISLFGATADYLLLAFANSFWMLLVGRAVVGLTSANGDGSRAQRLDRLRRHAAFRHRRYRDPGLSDVRQAAGGPGAIRLSVAAVNVCGSTDHHRNAHPTISGPA